MTKIENVDVLQLSIRLTHRPLLQNRELDNGLLDWYANKGQGHKPYLGHLA